MKGNSLVKRLQIFVFYGYLSIANAQPNKGKLETKGIGCQHWSTKGRSYAGEANKTVDGIPCQRWSDTQPHHHNFTYVGDHKFCRNPTGASQFQVWCYTTDPEVEQQHCLVPHCPPLKALDFSLDNDQKPDENDSYTFTHASLRK